MGPKQYARATMAYLAAKRNIRPDNVARSQTPLAASTRLRCTGDINDASTRIAGDSQLVPVCALWPALSPFKAWTHYDSL
jgi:hypothetical protein